MANNPSGKPTTPKTSGGIRRPGQASGKYTPAPKRKEKPAQEKEPVSASPAKEQKPTLQPLSQPDGRQLPLHRGALETQIPAVSPRHRRTQ